MWQVNNTIDSIIADIGDMQESLDDINKMLDIYIDSKACLDKQCELTFWTRKGQATFVPVKMPADDIIYQLKGSDEVPNGLYPSYYQVKGLELNGKPVYAITGFIPEGATWAK